MPNDTLAVVSQSGESIHFYDVNSGELQGKLANVQAEPHELCYDERTNLLYVTHAYEWGWQQSYTAAAGYRIPGSELLECLGEYRARVRSQR